MHLIDLNKLTEIINDKSEDLRYEQREYGQYWVGYEYGMKKVLDIIEEIDISKLANENCNDSML